MCFKLWVCMTSHRDSTPTLRCLIGKEDLAKETQEMTKSEKRYEYDLIGRGGKMFQEGRSIQLCQMLFRGKER